MTKTELALAQVAAATLNQDALMTVAAVRVATGYGRSAIYSKAKEGRFPKPCARGRWRAGDVLGWLREQGSQREHTNA